MHMNTCLSLCQVQQRDHRTLLVVVWVFGENDLHNLLVLLVEHERCIVVIFVRMLVRCNGTTAHTRCSGVERPH